MNRPYMPVQGQGFVQLGETEKQQNRGFSGIKKAAPIRRRLSEQLICRAKNKFEQGNYINRMEKRHNCRITGKTKATTKGRQWILRQIKLKRASNNATFAADGQCDQCAGLLVGYSCSLTSPCRDVFQVCDPIFVRLYPLRNVSRTKAHGANLSCSCSLTAFLRCFFLDEDNFFNDLSVIVDTCNPVRHSSPHHRTGDGYSCSLALRRWRRFSSCSTFSGKNPADLFSGSDGLLSVCFLVIHQPFGSLLCNAYNERILREYSLRYFSRANAHGANLSESCSCSISLRRLFGNDGTLVDSLSVIVQPCQAMRRSSSHHGAAGFYPLGSIPRCCNSLRIIRFIQAAKESSPSACCACSIFSRSSGSKRNWNGGLPRLSFLCVDTSITPHVMYLCVMTHYTQEAKKTTPRSAGTHAGRLTTNDSKIIEVAMLNHTTHPQGRDSHNLNKYIWRFIALSTAQPRVIHIVATSEQEARQKNQLIAIASQGYDLPTPAKSGAGIGVLEMSKAIYDAPASFLSSAFAHIKVMVGWAGASSEAPVPFDAGYANPVQSTASEIGVSCGGNSSLSKEAAIMATIPTLVHSQTAFIWRFIAFGSSDHQIIHVTARTEREARSRCPSGCIAVFAARIRQEVGL